MNRSKLLYKYSVVSADPRNETLGEAAVQRFNEERPDSPEETLKMLNRITERTSAPLEAG